MSTTSPTLIIGGGPSGLAAAYTLATAGTPAVVIEQSSNVGGLSSSFESHGCTLDYGPHFFNPGKAEAATLWNEVLGEQQVHIRIRCRMYWKKQWFGYPPSPFECLAQLGPLEGSRILSSMLRQRVGRRRAVRSYADRATVDYGARLFSTCFAHHVEKLLGIPCDEVSADWQPGRLRGLSLMKVLRSVMARRQDATVPHPRRGSGQLYDMMADQILRSGGSILTDHEVTDIEHDGSTIARVHVEGLRTGMRGSIRVHRSMVSSVPLPLLMHLLDPQRERPKPTLEFRSTVLVYLFLAPPNPFPDQCLYIIDPDIEMGRVTNFANWSPEMHPHSQSIPLCCEYWCDRGDATWNDSDGSLRDRALADLRRVSVAEDAKVVGYEVRRLGRTHPVMRRDTVRTKSTYTDRFSNLHVVGRGGSFSYVDQDDALLMGIRAAKAVLRSP